MKVFLSILLSVGLLAGCGSKPQNQVVKDVNLKTALVNNDIELTLSALFQFGSMSMTAITLPIKDPNDQEKVYGQISINPTFSQGFNQIDLMVNLSEAASIQGGVATLPNGAALPIAPINNMAAQILEMVIEQINSRIYLALDHDLVLLGFAISIKEFDALSQYLGGINLFLGFDIKGVQGSAGLYAGQGTMQSGLAFFVDLSSVVSPDLLNQIIHRKPVTSGELATSAKANGGGWDKAYTGFIDNAFKEVRLDSKTEKNFAKAYQEMSSHGNTLHYVK